MPLSFPPHLQKNIFVITAPSGTGKTTLNRRLAQAHPDLEISVSNTTRAKRPTEVNGDHYWFVTPETFQADAEAGKMLEWAEVFGNFYGTSLLEVKRILDQNHKVILEIDVQGWEQASPKIPGAQSIYILPPSIKLLWGRLQNRATESRESLRRRIETARRELDFCQNYQYFIINDCIESAYAELEALVTAGQPTRLTREEGLAYCLQLKSEFDSADWLKKELQ